MLGWHVYFIKWGPGFESVIYFVFFQLNVAWNSVCDGEYL